MGFVWLLINSSSFAQTTENFNSRTGIPLNNVKSYLQSHCWVLSEFDINEHFTPGIEGDGAIVSGQSSNPHLNMGIYTPVLDVPGNITVSFSYKFSNGNGNGHIRWLKIYLTDPYNYIEGLLDSIPLNNIDGNTVYNYSKRFNRVGSGPYKVYIRYGGTGLATRIGIDKLVISANKLYASGCNDAPVAVDDNIAGNVNRTASGSMCGNDSDPNHDPFTPYLVTPSPDGTVTINPDHSFSFTPNEGFSGNSASFTYRICDEGYESLCSNEATVNITFPSGSMLPVSLIDFTGSYKSGGNVELSWITTFESNSDRFDIERSLDGLHWIKAGEVKAGGNSQIKREYVYTDAVGRNTANKKDLYYRLKQIDINGRVAVSRILIVRVYNTRSLRMVSVTPNPAKNDIAVNVQLEEPSFVMMRIINTNGREILRKSMKASAGMHSYLMDGSSQLQAGPYLLEVIINSRERMVVKLIKE